MPKPAAAADVVSYWFAEHMATGPLSRDDAAHEQAVSARADLVKRLASADGDAAGVTRAWFAEAIATGAIARNTAAYNQAFAARDVLIARLAGDQVPANVVRPAKPDPKTAAPAKAVTETQA